MIECASFWAEALRWSASTFWLGGSSEMPFKKSDCAEITKLERLSVSISVDCPHRSHSSSCPNVLGMGMKPPWILQTSLTTNSKPWVTSVDSCGAGELPSQALFKFLGHKLRRYIKFIAALSCQVWAYFQQIVKRPITKLLRTSHGTMKVFIR